MKRSFLARIAARLIGSGPAAPNSSPPGDSPDEWHVGDIAECIAESGDWRCRRTGYILEDGGPQPRERYRVIKVDLHRKITGLTFAQWPGLAFSAAAFRKVIPRADEATAGTCATIKSLLTLAPQTDEVA